MLTVTRIALRRSLVLGLQRISRNESHAQTRVPLWRTAVNRSYCDGQALGKIQNQKMYLQFTCKKCSTRSSYFISKKAYENGVVIVECSGCKNNHLIADNLKWFRDERTNVEDLLREKGEALHKSLNDAKVIEPMGDENFVIKDKS